MCHEFASLALTMLAGMLKTVAVRKLNKMLLWALHVSRAGPANWADSRWYNFLFAFLGDRLTGQAL